MEVAQIHYTRLDEDNAGWTIVNASNGITEEVKDLFRSIYATTPNDRDMFLVDSFPGKGNIFLTKVTPKGYDLHGRQACFIHSYIFSIMDYTYIFENYDRFLCYSDFASKEETPITEVDDLPLSAAAPKINFDQKKVIDLMSGVYEAVLEAKSLNISGVPENNISAIKSIMALVYYFLPLSLRMQISFASIQGGRARTIVLSDSPNAGSINFNIVTGELTGSCKKYCGLASVLVTNPTDLSTDLDKIYSFIKDSSSVFSIEKDVYQVAFDYVTMKYGQNQLASDNIVNRLSDLLITTDCGSKTASDYMADLMREVVSRKISLAFGLQSKILDTYRLTSNERLKNNIADYMTLSYTKKCTNDDFKKLQKFKETDFILYRSIVNSLISNQAEDFINIYALEVCHSPFDCELLLNNTDHQCIDTISKALAGKIIADKDNGFETLKLAINTDLHVSVINQIVKHKSTDDLIWNYFYLISENNKMLDQFDQASEEAREKVVKVFVNRIKFDMSEKTYTMVANLMIRNKKLYESIEKDLSKQQAYKFLDALYTKMLLPAVNTFEDLKELADKLRHTSGVSQESIGIIIEKCKCFFARSCTSHQNAVNMFNQIICFIKIVSTETVYIKIKKDLSEIYWNKFNLLEWKPEEDYSLFYINNSKSCNHVKDLQKIVDWIKSEDWLNKKMALYSVNKLTTADSGIAKAGRDLIIKKIKLYIEEREVFATQGNSFDKKLKTYINIDLLLLLNYSNVTDQILSTISFPSLRYITEYINCNSSNPDGHMIEKRGVVISLYQIIYERINFSNRGYEYRMVLTSLDDYCKKMKSKDANIIYRAIYNIDDNSHLARFTWISTLSVIAIFAILFSMTPGIFENSTYISFFVYPTIIIFNLCAIIIDIYYDYDDKKKNLMFGLKLINGLSLTSICYIVVGILFKIN